MDKKGKRVFRRPEYEEIKDPWSKKGRAQWTAAAKRITKNADPSNQLRILIEKAQTVLENEKDEEKRKRAKEVILWGSDAIAHAESNPQAKTALYSCINALGNAYWLQLLELEPTLWQGYRTITGQIRGGRRMANTASGDMGKKENLRQDLERRGLKLLDEGKNPRDIATILERETSVTANYIRKLLNESPIYCEERQKRTENKRD